MASDHLRASDTDREAVVSVLRDAYTAGRLTLEEFDERTSSAYTSKTWGDLRELTRDLPEELELGADLPKTPLPPAPRLDADRVLPASRRPQRSRLAPLLVIWLIAGVASHSLEVAGVLLLIGVVTVLANAFGSARWDADHRERDQRRA
jgi:hypothetical protein